VERKDVHKLFELVVVERHAVADDLHQCAAAVVAVDAANKTSHAAKKRTSVMQAPVANEPFDRRLFHGAVVLFHVLQEVAAVIFISGAALIGNENGALTLKRHSSVVEWGKLGGGGRGGGWWGLEAALDKSKCVISFPQYEDVAEKKANDVQRLQRLHERRVSGCSSAADDDDDGGEHEGRAEVKN
jgi:hypothetical protein